MGVNGIYSSTVSDTYVANTTAKDKDVKDKAAVEETAKNANTENEKAAESSATAKKDDTAAVYDKRKLSEADRKTIVDQLKADQAKREEQLTSLVKSMMSKQTNTFGEANNIWQFLASGKYTVDAETQKKAQEAISEDGYWGVKQTSDRIVEFATALAGDDSKALEKMKDAFIKGFKQAEKTWGGKLPDISQRTYDAVIEKLDKLMKPEESEKTQNTDTSSKEKDTASDDGTVVVK